MMNQEKKNSDAPLSANEPEVLVEKVRELENAKKETKETKDKENTAVILHERLELSASLDDAEAKKQMSRRSRRTFLIGGAAALAGVLGWRWMPDETKNTLLRRTFEFNEKVAQLFYSPQRLAPEFSKNQLSEARVNGGEGMDEDFDPATWQLQVVGVANPQQFPQFRNDISYSAADDSIVSGATPGAKPQPDSGTNIPQTSDLQASAPLSGLLLNLNDIKNLPRTEMTTELKCIEGWSIIVNWAGVKFSDFMAKYLPLTQSGNAPDISDRPQDLAPYVAMLTPNQKYYVGLDMPSMLHPQTLLAYEMNGAPLTIEHGAPLRLVTPTKYGIKQIKRIGRIEFTIKRPADFWAEQGYDWYSGH